MTQKILIVDDEPDIKDLILAKFSKAIREKDLDFYFAANGQEALDLLEKDPELNIIFTDINMPLMDGLILLANLPRLDRFYKAVVVSGYGDISNIRKAMNFGASDFIIKPIDFADYEMTLKKMIDEYNLLKEAKDRLMSLYMACERFVPKQFVKLLGKESINEVNLGDQTFTEMSVLFCDIRGFTSMAEKLTPDETFELLNDFLGKMEPIIQKHGGFIDKYIGDAIMALFSNKPEDAIDSAIEILLNTPLKIGIGINTGELILGIIGSPDRIDGSVIGDTVNLASRLEHLTPKYHIPLLISDDTKQRLEDPSKYNLRYIGDAVVKGKSNLIPLWEVCDAEPPEEQKVKIETLPIFNEALKAFQAQDWKKSKELFQECLTKNPSDQVSSDYLKKCEENLT